jgi:hypothetical protein
MPPDTRNSSNVLMRALRGAEAYDDLHTLRGRGCRIAIKTRDRRSTRVHRRSFLPTTSLHTNLMTACCFALDFCLYASLC